MKKNEKKFSFALIMNDNSYSGREYLSKLKHFDIDVIIIGEYQRNDKIEDERCGNLWKPVEQDYLKKFFKFNYFSSLNSTRLISFLKKRKYDIGLQGGTGIIKKEIIDHFNYGIINFHPGDLPSYRGSSAPEWQIYENKNIICTAHFIDEGIDTGKVLFKKDLKPDFSSYHAFRSSIYPQIAIFVNEVLTQISKDKDFYKKAVMQDEIEAIYRSYIGDKRLAEIKQNFFN